eukprot:CAMPEP_0194213546 /NCGR_PEP_ID=MMETSP0156-20130528/14231_1 /TAXON_ID=33649 /ORGANISM="Thalassionema nitzschioides, Strain L26-B" /LENGTH=757 /DNA_ID=CAMNT_0038941599 /DNA_START=1 /DNA_END=2271 /DNA_ORIENTATION=+
MTKTERVQISLHAQNLKNVAGAFKGTSDPYAVVTLIASEPGVQPKILGKTEVIKNNLSPHWVAKFEVDYDFSKPTRFNVGIYDEVKKSENKSMGNALFEIGEVLGARGNIKAKKLKKGGTIFCRIEKAATANSGTFDFQLNGFKLKNVDGVFSKSDPFFEVSKLVNAAGGPTWQIAYRSETIKNDLNPKWKSVSIPLSQICGDNKDEKVVITVKDWEKSGKHTPMGSVETSVNGMLNKAKSGASFELKKKNKSYGNVVVISAKVEGEKVNPAPAATTAAAVTGAAVATASAVEASNANEPTLPITPVPVPTTPASTSFIPRPSFIDYLSGGLELQLSVAIDFTGSNGDPRKQGTLHYIDRFGGQLNSYEKALTSVGAVIAKYDHDQQFQMLGFGAKYGGVVQHCFQLGPTPEVRGVKGMIAAYRNTFKSGLIMSGPTVFADVIQVAASQARKKQESLKRFGQQAYHILLILTDGAVSDIARTKQALTAASTAPLSIVIVGMGSADFSTMQFLDDFATQEGIRDICQFVNFDRHPNKIDLTQATLDEIPDQVVDYFYSANIMPLPAVHGSQLNLVADEYNEEEEIQLDLNFNEDGEITLGSGGVLDETGYGDYNAVAGVTAVAPAQASAPQAYQPAQPYNPASAPQQAYVPTQQPAPAQPYNPASAPQQAYAPVQHQQAPAQPYNPPSAPQQAYAPVQPQQPQQAYAPVQPQQAYAPPQQQVINVQVPAGVGPGQQLQLQHPQTGQPMLVTVPQGVIP